MSNTRRQSTMDDGKSPMEFDPTTGGFIEHHDFNATYSADLMQQFLDTNPDEFLVFDQDMGYLPTPLSTSSQVPSWLNAPGFAGSGHPNMQPHMGPTSPESFGLQNQMQLPDSSSSPRDKRRQPPMPRTDSDNSTTSNNSTNSNVSNNSTNTEVSSNADDDWKPDDIFEIGYIDVDGNWRCNFGGCGSSKTYERACDLRKHYRSHIRKYFCKKEDCRWAEIGFATSKDCERHQASHNPKYRCPLIECQRTFSRAGEYSFPPQDRVPD